MMQFDSTFYWIAVAVVIVVSTARLSRLLVIDKFPPIKYLRDRYEARAEGSGWDLLTMCGYCMSVWTAAFVIVTADLAGVFDDRPWHKWMQPTWWFVFGGLAAAYAAAIVMALDQDSEDA